MTLLPTNSLQEKLYTLFVLNYTIGSNHCDRTMRGAIE